MNDEIVKSKLLSIARRYPAPVIGAQICDIERIAFHILLAADSKKESLRICDIGGGVGLFSVGCAAVGMRVVLVDDFSDAVNSQLGDSVLDLHREHGVSIISRDVIREGLDFEPTSFDVVTSFDSMEHWHHSPKPLFRQLLEALKPGGTFILGVPNCVNLRKRLTVPFGHGKWSGMESWYEAERFRGHVREPDVNDLAYIAHDLNLKDVRIIGRNWLGYASRYRAARMIVPFADRPLRLFPSLCSDIYLLGKKP